MDGPGLSAERSWLKRLRSAFRSLGCCPRSSTCYGSTSCSRIHRSGRGLCSSIGKSSRPLNRLRLRCLSKEHRFGRSQPRCWGWLPKDGSRQILRHLHSRTSYPSGARLLFRQMQGPSFRPMRSQECSCRRWYLPSSCLGHLRSCSGSLV